MLLASAAGLVVAVAIMTALAVRLFLATDRALVTAERAVRRQQAWANERTIFLSMRARIADGVQTGTDAVAMGSSITRVSHRAIAAIPFGILRAIPATRERSRRIQAAHDERAARVYESIETMSGRIADGVRRRLLGEAGAVGELESFDETQILEVEWEITDEIDRP
jgi:hypothetical protein